MNNIESSFIRKKNLSISVGVCAYNEERNIHYLLESLIGQENERIFIEEIIIVSDGSTDRTDDIVKNFCWNSKIKFIKLSERHGKYTAVNEFLKYAKSSILVLASADIILDENAIEKLCLPFLSNDNIGIIAAHPIPKNTMDSFLGYTVNLEWYLHHKLSLIKPKFGEVIAFRNIISNLPPTFVDEEQIASMIATKGHTLKYVPDAIVYNKGPRNIRDFLNQRRRIYAGHLILKEKYNYEVITFRGIRVLKCLLNNLSLQYIKRIHWLIGAIFLEVIARILGALDALLKKDHYRWKISESAKI